MNFPKCVHHHLTKYTNILLIWIKLDGELMSSSQQQLDLQLKQYPNTTDPARLEAQRQLKLLARQEACPGHRWRPSPTRSGIRECEACSMWKIDGAEELSWQMHYQAKLQ